MKALCLILFAISCIFIASVYNKKHDAVVEDNDFAEFEEFEDEDGTVTEEAPEQERQEVKKQAPTFDQEETFEEDDDEEEEDVVGDDEFDHLHDEEEFENFDKDKDTSKSKTPDKLPDLQMAKVPLHLRTSWDSFYLEMLMIAGLTVYFLNFLAGKNKNCKLATAWLSAHKELLETQFSIVGDDGVAKDVTSGNLMKESENVYALWCSGRSCVEGMLVEIKLLKRQDLINLLLRIFKPASDQVIVRVDIDAGKMENCNFVFCVAQKRSAAKLHKDMNDLSQFTEKKSTEKYNIPSSYQLLSEIGEGTAAILDKKVCQLLTTYEGVIEYIHVSDQYSGAKLQDDSQTTKMPETKPCLIFCFTVPGKGSTRASDMENLKPLMQLVFYCTDKVTRLQLSKEARVKAEKNRQKAAELFLKAAHTQRQELAQQRREEKKRAEKEKLMAEEDPDRARKLEDRESRRESKKKQPKMKMMKIKAM
ncbi:PAT complex subunit CCDC47-like [Physella acuta]|uniref:PAT complex subunit CCDC47-like n=1 Tax=Physella acuta TaxID=109671 RepID=UPI0027DB44CE|nr:PAT complex subunit CCDC47-like [Physella acuta]XP_059155690.1 PAT complex subunit CCDC47-like [Physella acuta]XP_059155691.1 PAT complex subunit CCDC47-like [Physella acuta]